MIYLDNHSTTPIHPVIAKCFSDAQQKYFANSANVNSILSKEVHLKIEACRKNIGDLFGVEKEAFVFTSGATESNNIALNSLARYISSNKNEIITTHAEHPSLLEPLRHLEKLGAKIIYLKLNHLGQITEEEIVKNISDKTVMVALSYGNSEIGTIYDFSMIAEKLKNKNIFLHLDAAQSGFSDDFFRLCSLASSVSFSAHKMNGPKGIGLLYYRRKNGRFRLCPLFFGGGQEKNIRPGTLNGPAILGIYETFQLIHSNKDLFKNKLTHFKILLSTQLRQFHIPFTINGDQNHCLPQNLSLTFKNNGDFISTAFLASLPDVALSTGSSCSSNDIHSLVLKEIGLNTSENQSTIRIGLGILNTEEEIISVANQINLKWQEFISDPISFNGRYQQC